MKILYHLPNPHSIYAQRTIFHGFRNAFIDMGHTFQTLTADDHFSDVLDHYRPDLFITASYFLYRKSIDYELLASYRREGLYTLVKIDFWNSPISRKRINEAPSLKSDRAARQLMEKGMLGDAYFHVLERDDPRMDGFEAEAGQAFHTIPLAADATVLLPMFDPLFASDIAYVGTLLSDKRTFFQNYVFPLGREFNLKLYGQDWSRLDRALGWIQRAGQLFNIPGIRSLRKPRLELTDEAKIYASSTVSINVHEAYQREFGGDCNERTFKIPLCGGFEVVDNVQCIKKYFVPDQEMIVANDEKDWLEKIYYFLRNPEERLPIIEAGRARVLNEHTYHHRAQQMVDIKEQAEG